MEAPGVFKRKHLSNQQDAALLTPQDWWHMPSDVRFAEIKRLLEQNGYSLKRISGSHHVFDKPGKGTIPIPVHHGKVKHVYLRQILKALQAD